MRKILIAAVFLVGLPSLAINAQAAPDKGPQSDSYQPYTIFGDVTDSSSDNVATLDSVNDHPAPAEIEGFTLTALLGDGVTACQVSLRRDGEDNPEGALDDVVFVHWFFSNQSVHHEFNKPVLITVANSLSVEARAEGGGNDCTALVLLRLNEI